MGRLKLQLSLKNGNQTEGRAEEARRNESIDIWWNSIWEALLPAEQFLFLIRGRRGGGVENADGTIGACLRTEAESKMETKRFTRV